MGQTGFCKNLRFSVVFCENHGLQEHGASDVPQQQTETLKLCQLFDVVVAGCHLRCSQIIRRVSETPTPTVKIVR